MDRRNLQKLTDYTSISIAGICVVHCLFIPVLLVLFPVVSSIFLVEAFENIFHEILLWLIIPSSSVAVLMGCRHHRDFTVFLLVGLGLLLILVGVLGVEEEVRETVLVLIGSLTMLVGHVRNFKLCRKSACDH